MGTGARIGISIVVAVGLLVAAGRWFESHERHKKPTVEVATTLATAEWMHTWCHDRDAAWPCVQPTQIVLDETAPANWQRTGNADDGYRACFNVYFQLENTRWDPTIGGPTEPRTYTKAPKPIHACGTLTKHIPGDWTFIPDSPSWYTTLLDAADQLLCAGIEGCP